MLAKEDVASYLNGIVLYTAMGLKQFGTMFAALTDPDHQLNLIVDLVIAWRNRGQSAGGIEAYDRTAFEIFSTVIQEYWPMFHGRPLLLRFTGQDGHFNHLVTLEIAPPASYADLVHGTEWRYSPCLVALSLSTTMLGRLISRLTEPHGTLHLRSSNTTEIILG